MKNQINHAKARWCAWDSNPWLQEMKDERLKWIHSTRTSPNLTREQQTLFNLTGLPTALDLQERERERKSLVIAPDIQWMRCCLVGSKKIGQKTLKNFFGELFSQRCHCCCCCQINVFHLILNAVRPFEQNSIHPSIDRDKTPSPHTSFHQCWNPLHVG